MPKAGLTSRFGRRRRGSRRNLSTSCSFRLINGNGGRRRRCESATLVQQLELRHGRRNGSCYRSHLFGAALADIKHRKTRPYRPQTNGKVERFNRTMLEEWAYVRPYASETERKDAFSSFLHLYNHHRSMPLPL